MKSFITTVVLTLLISSSFAHTLWIETSVSGKRGQSHEVKIYYGEFASNERDSVAKWYSDVKDFTLWLSAPGKEKVKLETVANTNYYSASFVPETDGLYELTISHTTKDLGGTTKYEFLASAEVAVGNVSALNAATNTNLVIKPGEARSHKLNSDLKLIAFLNGKPLVKKAVSVFSPQGWTKEFTTNEKGEIVFTPQWTGRYVAEVSNMEKVGGEHNGKKYLSAWQGATTSFTVVK